MPRKAWNLGRDSNAPDYSRHRISECEICHRNFEHYASQARTTCSNECRHKRQAKIIKARGTSPWDHMDKEKFLESISGTNNWNWTGGNNTKTRRKYMRPDKCIKCGETDVGRLDIDHINCNHSDNRRMNVQILCRSCHRRKHHFFNRQLGIRIGRNRTPLLSDETAKKLNEEFLR